MKAGTHLRLDKTGKAILTVLRHLNRVQEVRVWPVCFQLQWVVAGGAEGAWAGAAAVRSAVLPGHATHLCFYEGWLRDVRLMLTP